jgi:hypothetical protein
VRKAFDMILSGITCYRTVAARTGLSYGELFKLLHNPIWTGWRIYDQRCDPARRKVRADGRQGYSYKIARSPEEVIRVKVIETPLLTDHEWHSACRIMDAKREGYRRERKSPSLYCGFVFCDLCSAPLLPIRTAHRARYYVCRNRKKPGIFAPRCEQPYLRADQVEAEIDRVLSQEVTSKDFARKLAAQMAADRTDDRTAATVERLETELRGAQMMRDRAVDAFIAGMITREDCDGRVKAVDARMQMIAADLTEARCKQDPGLTAEAIAKAFEPFRVWGMLGREDRRRILALTIPRIRVREGKVTSFYRLLDGCDVPVAGAASTTSTHRTQSAQS